MANSLAFDIFAVDRASKVFDKVGKHAENMGGRFGKVGKVAGVMGKAISGAAIFGVAALGGAFAEGLKQAADYQKITAQTDAVIKSTGGSAKVSAEHVAELAHSIESYSAFSDEAVQQGENLLLTFTNIQNKAGKGNDIFDQSTKALYDMAQALGEDPKKAAIQLGKALNDPIKGITALKRVGVTFSEAQKKVIKHLVDTGHTAAAQKVILAELNKEFGGSAKAAGDTFAGSLTRIKNSLLDVLRDAITPLLPSLVKLTGWLADKIPGAAKALGGAIAWVKGKFESNGATVHKVTGLFSSLWGWVKEKLLPAFAQFGRQVLPALKKAIASVTDTLSKHKDIFQFLGTLLTDIILPVVGQVAKAVLTVLGPAFKLVAAIVSRVVIPALKMMINWWLILVGGIINGAAAAFGWVPKIGGPLKTAAKQFNTFAKSVRMSLGLIPRTVDVIVSAQLKSKGGLKLSNQARAQIAGRAAGGSVRAGDPYIVGERRAELFVPDSNGRIVPKVPTSGAGGGGNQYITVNLTAPGDDLSQARRLVALLQKLQQSSGKPLQIRTA